MSFVIYLLSFSPARAQSVSARHRWTLDECVKYALDHNIDVQRRMLNVEVNKNELSTARNEWLPTLSAGAGQQFSFGNAFASTGIMPSSTSSFSEDLSYTSAAVGVEMPVFDGFRTRNRIRAARWSVEQAMASLEHARKDLSIQVSSYYLQVLYEQGMAQVAEAQVETSRLLCQRTKELVSDGKIPKSDLADAEAQLASDEYELTECRGRVRMALLTLAQMLNLPQADDFCVADIDADEFMTAEIRDPRRLYQEIEHSYPSIVAANALVEKSKYDIETARAGYFPQLTFSASLNTYYLNFFHQQSQLGTPQKLWDFNTNRIGVLIAIYDPSMKDLSPQKGFGRQMWDNRSELLGLHLTVPIFDRFRTRNTIRKAKMMQVDHQLTLDDTRQKLRKEIEQAYYSALNAREKYHAAQKSQASIMTSYEFEQVKYDAGRSTLYDLTQAAQRLRHARENAIQAKYESIIRQKILEVYAK